MGARSRVSRWLSAAIFVSMAVSCTPTVDKSSTPSTTVAPATQESRGFAESDADALSAGLTSADSSVRSGLLASDIAQDTASEAPLLPDGSRVSIAVSSFALDPSGVGTVEAVVSGPSPGRWRLYLVAEDSGWKLLATKPIP